MTYSRISFFVSVVAMSAACADSATPRDDESTSSASSTLLALSSDSVVVEQLHAARPEALSASEPFSFVVPSNPTTAGGMHAVLEQGYLVGADGLDVRSSIVGGTAPYTCYIYEGPGEGTVPAGVWADEDDDESGCILYGRLERDWGDMPGNYGFFMVVEDSEGESLDVPVVYFGDPCDTEDVRLSPSADASLIGLPGAPQSWQLDVFGVDGVAYGDVCGSCFAMSLLTRNPLSIAARLECDEDGDWCSDEVGFLSYHSDRCPGDDFASVRRYVDLAPHDTVREGSGFVTMELSASYSGVSLDPCSGHQWKCHIEVLEVAHAD